MQSTAIGPIPIKSKVCPTFEHSASWSSSEEAGSFRSKHNSFFAAICFFPTRPCASPRGRCRLMWPPSACPMANSSPQIGHSCILGLFVPSSPANLGFLWLARCPPSAWKDENCLLQVLHSNTRPCSERLRIVSLLLCDRKTNILAMSTLFASVKMVSWKSLFMSMLKENKATEKGEMENVVN